MPLLSWRYFIKLSEQRHGSSKTHGGGTSFKFSEESCAYLSRSCRHGGLLILTIGSKRTLRAEELEFSKLKNGMADIEHTTLEDTRIFTFHWRVSSKNRLNPILVLLYRIQNLLKLYPRSVHHEMGSLLEQRHGSSKTHDSRTVIFILV